MATTIITPNDLKELKMELLEGVKQLLSEHRGNNSKKWLKSPEVMDLLGISSGTLQNLRVNGTLPYTKMGGLLYYDRDEIFKILKKNTIHNQYEEVI